METIVEGCNISARFPEERQSREYAPAPLLFPVFIPFPICHEIKKRVIIVSWYNIVWFRQKCSSLTGLLIGNLLGRIGGVTLTLSKTLFFPAEIVLSKM